MIDLYIMETCPFCRRVMDFMEQTHIEFNKIDITNSENHKRLMEIGGKDQVPFMVDENMKMYESNDIVEYLKSRAQNLISVVSKRFVSFCHFVSIFTFFAS